MAFVAWDDTPDADNSGATSYGSVVGLREYTSARKKAVPASDPDCQVVLILAMDYLEAQASNYKGRRTDDAQPLQWPRCGVFLYGSCTEFDKTKLPSELRKAQYELACIIAGGTDLYPVATGAFIKSEKVDVIETVYSESIRTTGQPDIPSVDAILEPLFSSGGFGLKVSRA